MIPDIVTVIRRFVRITFSKTFFFIFYSFNDLCMSEKEYIYGLLSLKGSLVLLIGLRG